MTDIASIAPDAPSICPVIDLVELIFMLGACFPKTLLIAFNSAISPSGVDVPCVLIASTSLAFIFPSFKQFLITAFTPSPSGCGAVI